MSREYSENIANVVRFDIDKTLKEIKFFFSKSAHKHKHWNIK